MVESTQLPPIYFDDEPAPPDEGMSLSLPPQDQDTGVSLAPAGGPMLFVPDDIATTRAKKTQEGLGKTLQKSTEDIKREISQGREDFIRKEAASKLSYENSLQKQKMLIDMANQKDGPLDEDAVARVMDPFNPLNRPVDPDNVVEKAYSRSYINSIQTAIDSTKSTLKDAQQEIPQEFEEAKDKGSQIKERIEYATKIKQDLGIQLQQQSYLGWGADQVKNMFQPYVELKMRGQNADVGSVSGGLLLGNNLQAQADKLILEPDDWVYRAKLKAITSTLAKDNISLAIRFAEYVEGVPQTDRYLDNFFTLMAVPDYATIGKGAAAIARKVSLNNRTNIAMKQLIKNGETLEAAKKDVPVSDPASATATPVNTQVARSEALGDTATATVQRSTDNIIADVQGKADPIKFATDDSLLTNLNQDRDKIASNPGKLSREQVVRIQDAYDSSGQSILQKLADAVRINRIPMAVATENAVRIIKDAIKDYYPGIRNAILDVSNPIYEPKSNTFWHDVTFGNFGGDLFSNPKTAKNFADLHGWTDTQIVEGYGKVTPVQTEKMLERQAFLKKQITDWEQTVQRRRAEARDTKLSDADKLKAKEQAEGITDFIKKAKTEADDLQLKLRNNETYNHVKRLENEITQHQIDNKDLRSAKGKDLTDEHGTISKEDIEAAISHNQAQIKAKAQEINAIKQGKADVIGGAPNTVEQHGVGFKIVIRRPLVETDKAVRDLLIRDASGKLIPEATSTSSQTGLKSLMNAAIGRFRGADDTLALNESIQRKIGTYSQSLLKQWAHEEMKYIRAVASGVVREDPVTGETIPYWKAKPIAVWNKLVGNTHSTYDAFTRTLDFARDAPNKITGKPGYFFQTPGELEDHYWKFFDRAPTFAEHQAYFSFVRLTEGDRIFREVAEFRNRARLGTEQFSISARGPDGKTAKSEFFDGISRKNFPGGDDVMMVMGKRLGDEKLVNLGGSAIAPNQLKEWREAVQQGRMRVVELYAAEHTPLRDFSDVAGNNHVRYILTDTVDSKPLEYNHVNRQGGGHFEYDYEHYIKQAKMFHQYENTPEIKGRYRSVYYGDTTFMPVDNRVMGRDIAGKLNEVQRLIREGNLGEAKRFTEDKLPIEWDKLQGMFESSRDEKGKVIPAQLDINEPFVMTTKGKSVLDMDRSLQDRHGKAFKDGTKSGSLNSQFQTAFNTERDSSGLQTFVNNGTAEKPLYAYAKADMVDPITTMNRALNRIMNTTYMDDYKIYAVEHWLREAEQHLELKEGQVNASPFWAFEQANDKSAFRSGTPIEVINNILNNRYKIKQFVGVPSSADTAIHAATQYLTDVAYNGSKSAVVPLWMLERIKDPITYMRSMTFNAKLGLFNPAQLLVQAQTHAAILSISPVHGTSGVGAALLHGWSAINGNVEILKGLDKAATKLTGFKAGEWMEAREIGNRTGFFNVAGEYANLDTALKTDFIGNDFKGFLKAGRWFFEKGEQTTRVSAWYTAFREFRAANPAKAITRDDIGAILNRADLLTINMSRASNSALNSSVLSLTTQFLNYQIRLAELFMGNRITPMAKFRMALFYSALYGAPSAIGLTGLPMANSIKEEAMQRGYVVGENWLKTAIMEGLPAVALAQVTGNAYNIGARYGSPGFTQLSDALKSDHAWYQLLAGASGTTLIDTLTAGNNFFHVVGSMLNPNNKDKAFPLKMDDFVDVFKGISSVNQAWKAIAAINTGKWMSKNEGYIGDVSKANAVFMAMTGLNPQAQDDLFLKADIRKSEQAMQKYYLKEFIQEYRRYLDAAKANNPSQAAAFATRAHTMLEISGYPVEKMATAYAIAAKGYESQIDSSDFAFAFKNVPRSRGDFLGIPTPFTTQSNIPATRQEQFRTEAKMKRDQR